jgi:pyruvate kinase
VAAAGGEGAGEAPHPRRAKLVCTLGPATDGRVAALAVAGMDVARVNLAHGTRAEHEARIAEAREAEASVGRPIPILVDLPGPKIRLGDVPDGELTLERQAPFFLRPPGAASDREGVPTTHGALASDLRPGDRILLADGAVELTVTGSRDGDLETIVERGGTVRSRAGLSAPAERLSIPALTDRDRAAVPWLLESGVEFVGQSFVRTGADIAELRRLLGSGAPAIIAKIETRAAVDAFEGILDETDAVMVARGDLGVELPFEDVPLVQKALIRRALARSRPVIVATQMLESMTAAPRPTRAEVSDVANALLDGTDCVMLSGESAIGRFPVLSAEAAIRIVTAIERGADPAAHVLPGWASPGALPTPEAVPDDLDRDASAIAVAAVALARADPDVELLACFTRTGRTARVLSALRPPVPVLALTADRATARRLALHHGLWPVLVPPPGDDEAVERDLQDAIARARNTGWITPGAAVVLVASSAGGAGPNLVEVRRVDR